ncbi:MULTISPECIES: hypothetical protein [unclassified Nocardiopsis]|uniref:hypothetical protein n=1 Tax=Nocardiopsis TaxID=2013 RepID=UPI00387B619C
MRSRLRRSWAFSIAVALTASLVAIASTPAQADGLAVAGPQAAAAPHIRFDTEGMGPTGDRYIAVYIDGHYAGQVFWNSDPWQNLKGDTVYAQDARADGYGITGRVYRNGSLIATATTSGHNAPYTASKSNNIAENVAVTVVASVVKGGTTYANSAAYSGRS